MKPTRSHLLLLLLPAALLLVTGCVRLPREPLEIHRYSIDLPDSTWSADTTLALTILVNPFLASSQQRGDRIYFRDGDAERSMNSYYYHRWVTSPERMMGDVLAQCLARSGLFEGGVFQGETGVIPTHEIQGRLATLYANNKRGHYNAVFDLKLTVFRIDPATFEKSVIFQENYPIEVPRRNNYVPSYVDAVNDAVTLWLEQVRRDLVPLFKEEADARAKLTSRSPINRVGPVNRPLRLNRLNTLMPGEHDSTKTDTIIPLRPQPLTPDTMMEGNNMTTPSPLPNTVPMDSVNATPMTQPSPPDTSLRPAKD